jgi:hypothetical protein
MESGLDDFQSFLFPSDGRGLGPSGRYCLLLAQADVNRLHYLLPPVIRSVLFIHMYF